MYTLLCYVAAKATYIRLFHGKIGFLEGFFGPSSVKRGRHIVLGWNMGISPPDSFSFRFSSSSTTSGDIFYCSGSRQLNHSSFCCICCCGAEPAVNSALTELGDWWKVGRRRGMDGWRLWVRARDVVEVVIVAWWMYWLELKATPPRASDNVPVYVLIAGTFQPHHSLTYWHALMKNTPRLLQLNASGTGRQDNVQFGHRGAYFSPCWQGRSQKFVFGGIKVFWGYKTVE